MPHGGHGRRFERDIRPKLQGSRTHIGFADYRLFGRSALARHQEQQQSSRQANFRYGTEKHSYYSVYQRLRPGPNLKWELALITSRAWLYAVAALAGAALLAWTLSKPHSPLEYMVAGTLATTLCLLGAFVRLVTRRRI
jgi:hypothetical protein